MNRSALTIKMLNYLKAKDLVSREELAEYLETNIRNVSEFKKELETAGYMIESVSGKYGGYRLDENSLIPTIALEEQEIMALNDASRYLHTANFHQVAQFDHALMKIKNNLRDPKGSQDIHYLFHTSFNHEEQGYSKLFMEAKERNLCVEFSYRKLGADIYETRRIQPYELVYSDDGNYVLGYDITANKSHLYKTFKISSLRMKDVIKTTQVFLRDTDFNIRDYIGTQNILKETYEVELLISGQQATLLYEKEIGILCEKKQKGNQLYLKFTMENKMKILEFVLSLGDSCKILSPDSLKDEVIDILSKSLKQYMV